MSTDNPEQAVRRPVAARVGVTALNLAVPGLGLIRVGDRRSGLLFMAAPFALLALVTWGFGHWPITGYASALAALVLACGLIAVLVIVPALLTWRRSRVRTVARGWSRWYGVVAIAVVSMALMQGALAISRRLYRPFYAPSASMAPTIVVGDKFVVDMRWRGPARRGDVILFQTADSVRVSRVAAVAGDRIAVRGGLPIVNGVTARRRLSGTLTIPDDGTATRATMSIERLPGEASTHRVIDVGDSPFDDVGEVVVPAGHLFVLGDNRDRSADSRVSPDQLGVGMVPESAIIGRPMYIHWSDDHARIGRRLDG